MFSDNMFGLIQKNVMALAMAKVGLLKRLFQLQQSFCIGISQKLIRE